MSPPSAPATILLLALLSSASARGYSCDADVDNLHFRLEPSGTDVAPLNSRVRVFCKDCRDVKFLRLVVRGKSGPVPGRWSRLAASGELGVEFAPTQLLDPETRYQVSIVAQRFERAQTREVGSFVTGAAVDPTAPHGAAVVDGAIVLTDLKTDANVIRYNSLQLTAGDASDDSTRPERLLYAVWGGSLRAPLDAPIDYSRPPQGYFHAPRDDYGGHRVIRSVEPQACSETSFPTPAVTPNWKEDAHGWDLRSVRRLPSAAAARWRVGVRAVDLAGNQGPVAEVIVDLAQPAYAFRAEDFRNVCDGPEETIWALPRSGSTVPRNSRIWIGMGVPHRGVFGFGDEEQWHRKYRLTDSKRTTVPTTSRTARAGSVQVTELSPVADLVPGALYRVLDQRGRQVTAFNTGDQVDREAPTGLVGAPTTTQRPPMALRFPVGGVSDGHTATEDLLFGVWPQLPGGKFNFDAEPRTYVRGRKGALNLGEGTNCDRWNYSFPIESRTERLAIRPVDLAGNRGPATEAVIDVRSLRGRP